MEYVVRNGKMNIPIPFDINVIFLDIDSVLNHSPLGECYEGGEDNYVNRKTPISKDNLQYFKYIVDNTENLRIVWSTSWRFEENPSWQYWKNPRLYLEKQEWFPEIIGKTPKKFSSTRSDEIHLWLNDNERNKYLSSKPLSIRPFNIGQWYNIRNFVIIDDECDGMKRFGPHYFQTDVLTGLTEEQSKSIVEFLKTKNYNRQDWFSIND